MDMNTAFDLEVRQHCPNAEVVYDLFHVVARFGREVVDRVRVDQANALRQQPASRKVIKRSRWLLLRNRDNLPDEQAVKLNELLAANTPLATVYLLKTELKELWFAPSIREGVKRWRRWYRLSLWRARSRPSSSSPDDSENTSEASSPRRLSDELQHSRRRE